jgi:hypothetical protein
VTDVPTPDREDPLFSPFWAGTDVGELRIQRCTACGTMRWPPRPICASCLTLGNHWAEVKPSGTLFSWVGVDHQTVGGLPPPYTVALVQLDTCPVRLLGRLVDVDRQDLRIGMHLAARFERSDSGITLVNWAPDSLSDERTP